MDLYFGFLKVYSSLNCKIDGVKTHRCLRVNLRGTGWRICYPAVFDGFQKFVRFHSMTGQNRTSFATHYGASRRQITSSNLHYYLFLYSIAIIIICSITEGIMISEFRVLLIIIICIL